MKSASPRSFFCLREWPYLPLPARLRHNTKRKTSCGSALFKLDSERKAGEHAAGAAHLSFFVRATTEEREASDERAKPRRRFERAGRRGAIINRRPFAPLWAKGVSIQALTL